MAYDRNEMFKKAVDLVKSKRLFFHQDVYNYLAISDMTYSRMFPKSSDEWKTIDTMLHQNRVITKNGIRHKWYESDGASQTIALYKLIATDDERKRLSQTYTDITSNGDSVFTAPEINFNVVSPDPVEVEHEKNGGEDESSE